MNDTTIPLILKSGTPLERGRLYARLFHGRNDPEQEMQGWGFAGPVFGPLRSVSLTYLQHLRLLDTFSDHEVELSSHDDMLAWRGAYYGDFLVFVAEEGDTA